MTLVIAVVGVTLAALSLGWQAATFFLTGPRVKVYLREGFRGPRGVMIAPPSIYTEGGLEALGRMGYVDHVLAVEAVNRGRLPATVHNWAIRFGNNVVYTNPADPQNPQLPYRLESHTSASWYAPLDDLQSLQPDFHDQSVRAATARGEVDLQSRRRAVTSRDALVIDASGTRNPRGWRLAIPWRMK